MNSRLKFLLFVCLIAAQIVFYRYNYILKLNIDFLFLILVYLSRRPGFLKGILAAAVIGLITDCLSVHVYGVFGFSRTAAAYMIGELSRFFDLRRYIFIFLLVFISLAVSNFIANVFFYFILGHKIGLNLVFYPPLFTGSAAVLILSLPKMKENLDVY
ncbi:MAG: rod shape-determining protein MreD [Candidatus Aminicenantes bacterium]|nr:rod shape-determining protein MreD [Candidatus Aminicenantes bacterium]